jgi:hypothetical protein
MEHAGAFLSRPRSCGPPLDIRFKPQQTSAANQTTSAKRQNASCTATASALAAVSVKRIIRTYRYIKTGWCSARRVTHLWMAAARNRYAADDRAGNLWLCGSCSLRMTLVLRGLGAGRHQRKREHNSRNNGYDRFHRDPPAWKKGRCPERPFFFAISRNGAVIADRGPDGLWWNHERSLDA